MAVSPYAAMLRSPAGYVKRPSTTAYEPPRFAAPQLPRLPAIDDARAPNSAARAWLGGQLGQLPGATNARLSMIRADTKQRLAGYGGFKFREDNPSTPEREDLTLDFDGEIGPGEREKEAIKQARNVDNANGMLSSSFANQNIGNAIQRLSLEAQQIANQYAKAILDEQTSYAGQVANITGQWVGLYGQDSQWLLEHPPPPAAPEFNADDPSTWTPEQLRAAPPKNRMSFKDFLKGRKPTKALALQWDNSYNYGRRFGGA